MDCGPSCALSYEWQRLGWSAAALPLASSLFTPAPSPLHHLPLPRPRLPACPPTRSASQVRKAPRRAKSLASDFPLGATGLYLSLAAFVAFICSALYWVVVVAYPKD
ncbi:hypothetical protein TSOC_014765 [Tetrabaena socialis]|uniref:Uncharacterized protein n=1 Tax=Tetrabaena socialis TaxID=47790 RepID=A0A2J7ZGR5_9CHLO|nr:hypothetical protein TSOC_014765 [Tetrabaena socialis]|eukprot:PNG99456.1 hypothetical protein TSOC_014765 [Tetrabaena socialis]